MTNRDKKRNKLNRDINDISANLFLTCLTAILIVANEAMFKYFDNGAISYLIALLAIVLAIGSILGLKHIAEIRDMLEDGAKVPPFNIKNVLMMYIMPILLIVTLIIISICLKMVYFH